FAASVILLAVMTAFSQNSNQFSINESPLGPPSGYVNDYAGVLDAATKQQIESKINQFKDTSNPTTELAVAIVRTTGDRDIFDYSLAVARGWKIGSKQDDNPGALLFIAIDDRKYFTQVSKDLEDELPDGLVGQLNRQYLVPAFKQGNYNKGVTDTIDAYIRTIEAKQKGQPTPTPEAIGKTEKGATSGGICGTVICLIIIFIILMIIFGRKTPPGGGSG